MFRCKCHWMKPFLDESVVDEIVFCFWMKVFLDESVFGCVFFFFRIWMKVYLTAKDHQYLKCQRQKSWISFPDWRESVNRPGEGGPGEGCPGSCPTEGGSTPFVNPF